MSIGDQDAIVVPQIRLGRPPGAVAAQLGDRILKVALEHFLTHGYEGARLESIAADAKVTRRTLYQRYGSKRGVLAAVARQQQDHFLDMVDICPRGDSVRDRLITAALNMLDAALSSRSLALSRLREEIARLEPDLLDGAQHRILEGWTAIFQSILSDVPALADQGEGRLASLAAFLFDMLVIVPRERIYMFRILADTPEAKVDYIGRTLDLMVQGLPFLKEAME